jgi:hypothetical protein
MSLNIGPGVTINAGVTLNGGPAGGGSTPIAADALVEFSNYPSGAQLSVTTTNSTLISYVTGLSAGATLQFNVISSSQGTYAGTGTIGPSPSTATYNAGISRLNIPLDPSGFTWDAGSQVLGNFEYVTPPFVNSVTIG